MLSNLILVALQFAVAFLGAPEILRFIPASGDLRTFVHAAIYAVIVYVVGLLASIVLKDVYQRSPAALSVSLVLALIGAAVVVFAPAVLAAIPLKFPPMYLPLILAIVGYFIRR